MKNTTIILFAAFGLAQAQVKVLSNGNIGIGTTPIVSKVHINTDNDNSMLRITRNTNFGVVLGIDQGNNTLAIGAVQNDFIIRPYGTGTMRFTNANGNIISTFTNSGNVGIGELIPTARLTIQATDGSSAFWAKFYVNFDYGDATKTELNRYNSYAWVVRNTIDSQLKFRVDGWGGVWAAGAGVFGGNMMAQSFTVSSDKCLKRDITNLNNAMSYITALKGQTYKMIPEYNFDVNSTEQIIDTSKTSSNASRISKKQTTQIKYNSDKKRYGFIAQEVQTVMPELVQKDSLTGLLSVDYISVIPILVEALKEQNTKVIDLEARLKKLEKGKAAARTEDTKPTEKATDAILYQNTPNPFSGETQIKYYLPETTKSAFITITDLNGKQVKLVSLSTKGESTTTLKANELQAGMYIYTLVADGNIVDSKRMVIVD